MKKITLLLICMLSFAGFSQNTCATAVTVTPGTTYSVTAIDGDAPTVDCLDSFFPPDAAEWYKVTATVNGVITISSDLAINIPNDPDTRLQVYTGTCGSLTCYASNDDSGDGYMSTATFAVTPGTTYYFLWDNGYDDTPFSFTVTQTVVDCTVTLPLAQDFSNQNIFNVCHTVQDVDANGIAWIAEALDLNDDGTDETFATNGSNDTAAKNDWLFSPSIALTAGLTYTITYKYNGADGANDANETLRVLMTNGATSTATFQQQLGLYSGIVQTGTFENLETQAISQTVTFIPATTGNYNLAFNVTSPASSGFLLLFEYTVSAGVLSTQQFSQNNLKVYPNPASNQLTVSQNDEISAIEIFNLMGQKVLSQNANSNEVTVNISSLSVGTYSMKVTSGNSQSVVKVVKN